MQIVGDQKKWSLAAQFRELDEDVLFVPIEQNRPFAFQLALEPGNSFYSSGKQTAGSQQDLACSCQGGHGDQ